MTPEHFEIEDSEYVFDCGRCGSEVRVELRSEAVEYAMRTGKPCPECGDPE